jgi:uncharacterized membrane protein YkoI
VVTLRRSQLKTRAGAFAAFAAGVLIAQQLPARPLVESRSRVDVVDVRDSFAPSQRGGVSLEEAIQRATEQHPGGRVVRAVTIEERGRRVHEIRILLPPEQGGRVVTVHIDAGGG